MPHPLLIVSLAALVGAIVAGVGAWKVRDVNRWPSAQVTVTDTGIRLAEAQRHQRERDEQAKRYLAHVAVEGRIEGRLVTSDNSGFDGVPSFERREDAEGYLAAYPVGSQITVRYSPRDPSIIHLGTASLPWGRLGLAGFLLMASLGAIALYTTET